MPRRVARQLSTAQIAPPIRRALAARTPLLLPDVGRRAAVLVLLHDLDGTAHLTLTKRSEQLALHGGQISLPGGRREAHDVDLAATALRETSEEVGVAAADVELLGRLDDVETMASGYRVSPYVGRIVGDARPSVRDRFEVARVMEIPLSALVDADALVPRDAGVRTLRYPLDGEDVWGATARILRDFVDVVRRALPADRDGRADEY